MGTGASGLFSEMLRSFGQDITNDNMADVEILYYRETGGNSNTDTQ